MFFVSRNRTALYKLDISVKSIPRVGDREPALYSSEYQRKLVIVTAMTAGVAFQLARGKDVYVTNLLETVIWKKLTPDNNHDVYIIPEPIMVKGELGWAEWQRDYQIDHVNYRIKFSFVKPIYGDDE